MKYLTAKKMQLKVYNHLIALNKCVEKMYFEVVRTKEGRGGDWRG